MKKKLLVITLLLLMFFNFSGAAFCLQIGKINYDLIYEDMPILDFMFETNRDPQESADYQGYFISPYVLTRLPVKLRNKKTVLSKGYYLIKPEKKDGYNFVIFKQNGIIMGIIPIYKTYRTNPAVIFPPTPKPRYKWYVKPFVVVRDVIKWPFKKLFKHKKPLMPPRAKADFKLVGNGEYYDMGLYIENHLYKMLFKLEK